MSAQEVKKEAVEDADEEGVDFDSEFSESSHANEFPSSPPARPTETDQTDADETTPEKNRKRSHDAMDDNGNIHFASSMTMIGDVPSSAFPPTQADSMISSQPSAHAHTMGPPARPPIAMSSSYQITPTSAQAPKDAQSSKAEPAQAPLNQRQGAPSPEREPIPIPDDPVDTQSRPQDKLLDFDWTALAEAYHKKIGELREDEQAAMEDFRKLCQLFSAWSDAGSNREIERGFKRFKTQECFVQHEETELEKTRNHYIQVVNAFKRALELLTDL